MTDRETLFSYRLAQAEETLLDAEKMLGVDVSPRSILNRAYYAAFYAVLALFLKENINVKTSRHAGVVLFFDKEFVQPGKISKTSSKAFHKLFNARQEGDYKELMQVTHEEAINFVNIARELIKEIKKILEERR